MLSTAVGESSNDVTDARGRTIADIRGHKPRRLDLRLTDLN